MNDKIKELTKKAFMLAHEANDVHEQEEGEEFSETEFDNVFIQKFAELIVQECILVIQKDVIRNGNTPENQRTTTHLMAIRDHFGYDNSIFETWKLLK